MEAIITILFAFLPVCLFLLCGGLVFGLAAFFVFRTVSQVRVVPKIGREEFLAQAGETLLPWSQDAFEDIAARWQGDWSYLAGLGNLRGYFQGVVKSLCRPDESGWLAFHLDRPGAKEAHLHLHTSAHQIALDLQLEKIIPPTGEAAVTLDGRPFGRIRLPECAFFEPDGDQIGHYKHRYTGLRMVRIGPRHSRYRGHRLPIQRHYGPVVIGDRLLAEMTDVWVRRPERERSGSLRFSLAPEPYPALRELPLDFTATEEQWLLVALALELFFDTNWIRKTW